MSDVQRPEPKSPKPNNSSGAINPSHYTQGPVEAITVCENLSFNLGNAVKYIWRLGLKDPPIKELGKARWYVCREIRKLALEERENATPERVGELNKIIADCNTVLKMEM